MLYTVYTCMSKVYVKLVAINTQKKQPTDRVNQLYIHSINEIMHTSQCVHTFLSLNVFFFSSFFFKCPHLCSLILLVRKFVENLKKIGKFHCLFGLINIPMLLATYANTRHCACTLLSFTDQIHLLCWTVIEHPV